MIVLDASVLIAHLVEGDAHSSTALDILDTEDELGIHPMTLAECLVGPVRVGLETAARHAIDRLGVRQLPAPPDEPLALARLRVRTGLKLPDCCTLSAALVHDASLATFDTRLAAAARGESVTVLDDSL
jgi:predicted nucleic acid-binding protein